LPSFVAAATSVARSASDRPPPALADVAAVVADAAAVVADPAVVAGAAVVADPPAAGAAELAVVAPLDELSLPQAARNAGDAAANRLNCRNRRRPMLFRVMSSDTIFSSLSCSRCAALWPTPTER